MDKSQKELYEQSWATHSLRDPVMWPMHVVIKKLLKENGKILEIGPGNWPKSPVSNTVFLELTVTGASNLRKIGANTSTGSIENIPFKNETFDIVVALEVIEHVPNVLKSFSEVKRVLKKKGYFIFSTPIHQKLWTHFDSLAGHLRRFDPIELLKIVYRNEFQLIKFIGRSDIPVSFSNINALLEERNKKLMMFLSELGINILSKLHSTKFYRILNRQAYDLDLWFNPNLYVNMSKNLGNLTLVCQKK
ncbi:MAG: class I SAM-dependent methyltransferase [Candidatus Hodarchaeales archaeon]|jgi:SAM-dependent methyltransferase